MATKKPFAEGTSVSVDASVQELKKMLEKYGIEEYLTHQKKNQTIVAFKLHGRGFRFTVPMPDPEAKRFVYVPGSTYRKRTAAQQEEAYKKEVARRWRVLVMEIKARLVAIDEGWAAFEEQFLDETLLPDGRTVKEWVNSEFTQVQLEGKLPNVPLLPPGT